MKNKWMKCAVVALLAFGLLVSNLPFLQAYAA